MKLKSSWDIITEFCEVIGDFELLFLELLTRQYIRYVGVVYTRLCITFFDMYSFLAYVLIFADRESVTTKNHSIFISYSSL